jgi:hypothetical protein
MPDRFEQFNNALVFERILVLVKLEIVAPDQAFDERLTRHHDRLPGLRIPLALIFQDQLANLGFMKKYPVRLDPLGMMHRADFLAGRNRTLHVPDLLLCSGGFLNNLFGLQDVYHAVAEDPHSDPFLAFRNSDVQFGIDVKPFAVGCRKCKRTERFSFDVFLRLLAVMGSSPVQPIGR